MKPKVACLTPTYGRASRQPHLINEAVKCFVDQDYDADSRVMIILNDADCHEVTCPVNGVFVYNTPHRFVSLGAKCNVLVDLAIYHGCEVAMMWEDDDLSLPHRISASVKSLEGYEYYNPGLVWYEERGKDKVADGKGVMHHASAYLTKSFKGKYSNTSKGHDAEANHWAFHNLKCSDKKVKKEEDIFYIYRWGYSDFHLSGQSDMTTAYKNADPGKCGSFVLSTGDDQ